MGCLRPVSPHYCIRMGLGIGVGCVDWMLDEQYRLTNPLIPVVFLLLLCH